MSAQSNLCSQLLAKSREAFSTRCAVPQAVPRARVQSRSRTPASHYESKRQPSLIQVLLNSSTGVSTTNVTSTIPRASTTGWANFTEAHFREDPCTEPPRKGATPPRDIPVPPRSQETVPPSSVFSAQQRGSSKSPRPNTNSSASNCDHDADSFSGTTPTASNAQPTSSQTDMITELAQELTVTRAEEPERRRKNFKRLLLKLHPDKNSSSAASEAFQYLVARRQEYLGI